MEVAGTEGATDVGFAGDEAQAGLAEDDAGTGEEIVEAGGSEGTRQPPEEG